MHAQIIDVNVDVGEGVGNELKLMPYVSSCNIACGGHAGNKDSMSKVVKLAQKHGVKIGAHPSFPDVENFGRKAIKMSSKALFESLKKQINDLLTVLDEESATLHHIKPHGALYNLAVIDAEIASVIVELVKAMPLAVKLYVPYQSVIEDIALQNNIPIIYEVFADRNYNADLTLVSRAQKNALIYDADSMFKHVFRMVNKRKVKTVTGEEVCIKAETFCLHGDNFKAEELLKKLHENLETKNIKIG